MSIVSLSLEYVDIKENSISDGVRLPSLKTMSLKNACLFSWYDLSELIKGCSSIEYLSITSCSSRFRAFLVVSSSTVKSLEIRDCVIGYAEVRRSKNLESFTWVSSSPELRHAALLKGQSLKYINIHAEYLKGIMQRSCGGHNVYSKSKIFQFQCLVWYPTMGGERLK